MSGEGAQQLSNSGSIPAGWYPDPAGSAGKRWWDGASWTENVREPEAAPPQSTSFGNYVPAELRPTIPVQTADVGIAYSRASWWIAGSPLWVVVPQVVVFVTLDTLDPLPVSSLALGVALLSALAWCILIRLAFADRSSLISGGNDTVASAWWTLLTPLAYLIVRARQVQLYAVGGWASVLWWCLAAILSPGVAVLAAFAVFGILPT